MKGLKTLGRAFAAEGRRLRALTLHQWVQIIAGGWFLCLDCLLLFGEGSYTKLAFGQSLPLPLLLLALVVAVEVVLLLNHLFPRARAEGYILLFAAGATALLLAIEAAAYTKFYLYYALAAAMAILLFYAAGQGLLTLPRLRPGRRASAVVTGALLVLMAAAIALVGVLRYLSFVTPNYDFGIFCQMFHNMKESFLPLTTCERDRLLSHFAVHFSPIYYLLLPFYVLFPSPITLQIGQAVVLASGGIPLYLLSRRLGLSYKQTLFAVAAYALYPALSCGTLYDLHENCFLAPLLLWMFYAFECGRTLPIVLTAALTLLVKEDAAVSVALFALFWMVSRRRERVERRRGAAVFLSAVLYFTAVLLLMNRFGIGVMTNRYQGLQYGNSGLLGMVKTLLVNPGYALQEMFAAEGGANKLRYCAQLAVPLGLALFSVRRPSRLLLLTPVLLNLFASSEYQCDIGFQYSFGITAFFFYLCLLNLRDMPPVKRRERVSYMAAAAALLYAVTFLPQMETAVNRYARNRVDYQNMTAALETIPDDASVACSTFLLPHLAQRAEIYEDYYHVVEGENFPEYLVLDLRPNYDNNNEKVMEKFSGGDYEVVLEEGDLLRILRRADAAP